MNIWTMTDAVGGLHGPWADLMSVNRYISQVKPPEPLILTQTLNGASGTAAEVIAKALKAIGKEASNVERPEPQG